MTKWVEDEDNDFKPNLMNIKSKATLKAIVCVRPNKQASKPSQQILKIIKKMLEKVETLN